MMAKINWEEKHPCKSTPPCWCKYTYIDPTCQCKCHPWATIKIMTPEEYETYQAEQAKKRGETPINPGDTLAEHFTPTTQNERQQLIKDSTKFYENPNGEICYAFGKHKDQPATSNKGYLKWMLNADFDETEKELIKYILANDQPKETKQ